MVLKRRIEKKLKNKKIRWSLAEIDRMINAFTENQHSTTSTNLTKETFTRIADYMIEEGFPARSPQQIRSKWFQLKSAFIGYGKIATHKTRKIPEVFRRKIAEYIQNEIRIEHYQKNFGNAAAMEYFKGGKNLIGAAIKDAGRNDEGFGCCGDNKKAQNNSKMAAVKGVVAKREDNEAIFDDDDDEEAIFDFSDGDEEATPMEETDDDNDANHEDHSDAVVVNNSLTCCLTFHDASQNRTLILPADDLFYVRNRRQFVLNLENERLEMWRTFMHSVSKY